MNQELALRGYGSGLESGTRVKGAGKAAWSTGEKAEVWKKESPGRNQEPIGRSKE